MIHGRSNKAKSHNMHDFNSTIARMFHTLSTRAHSEQRLDRIPTPFFQTIVRIVLYLLAAVMTRWIRQAIFMDAALHPHPMTTGTH